MHAIKTSHHNNSTMSVTICGRKPTRHYHQHHRTHHFSFLAVAILAMSSAPRIFAGRAVRRLPNRTHGMASAASSSLPGCFVSPFLLRRHCGSQATALSFSHHHSMPSPSSPPSSYSSINKNKNTQKRNSFSSAVNAINSQLGASAAAATAVDKNPKKQPQQRKPQSNTGRLRQLPPLQPATEILSRSQRLTYQTIKDDTKIANVRRRTQKRGAQTIDLLCQKLCSPLKHTVQTYERELKYMHPFEKVIMELTIRSRQKKDGLSLSTLLHDIHQGRKELLSLSKDWIYKIKNAQSARESYEFTEEAKELLSKVFLDLIQESWSGIAELQKSLRDVPIVRLDCPAVVLVGAPNVGKSSIVRAISSGTPEVNNYPFTTRGMTLGHVQVFWESEEDVAIGNVAGVSIPSERDLVQEKLERRGIKTRRMMKMMMEEEEGEKMMMRDEFADVKNVNDIEEGGDSGNYGRMNEVVTSVVDASDGTGNLEIEAINSIESTISKRSFAVSQLCQIMDSPGLLRRDNTEIRNEMEELTLAAMSHLPTAVMYVMDLSGGAGDKCSSVEDQLILRREVRARFPRRPWIDVISKVDLGIVDGARERLTEIMETERLEKAKKGIDCDEEHYFIELSIKEGKGVEELRQEVMRMLGEVRVVLDAMAKMDERSARV